MKQNVIRHNAHKNPSRLYDLDSKNRKILSEYTEQNLASSNGHKQKQKTKTKQNEMKCEWEKEKKRPKQSEITNGIDVSMVSSVQETIDGRQQLLLSVKLQPKHWQMEWKFQLFKLN